MGHSRATTFFGAYYISQFRNLDSTVHRKKVWLITCQQRRPTSRTTPTKRSLRQIPDDHHAVAAAVATIPLTLFLQQRSLQRVNYEERLHRLIQRKNVDKQDEMQATTEKNNVTTPVRGGESNAFPTSDMLKLVYMEAIPRASYLEWRKDPSKKLSLIKPASEQNLADMDTTTKERHDIGYLCSNLESWKLRIAGQSILPTFDAVKEAKISTVAEEVEYDRDGLVWRSDYQIHIRRQSQARGRCEVRRLVLHLPNDGFFYVAESLLPVLVSNRRNERHLKTCSEGWAYLDQNVWPKLAAFDHFARDWFGYDNSKKLRRLIMYNDLNNRMDICILCPDTNVSVDFVFEPGYPVPEVPEDFWF